MNAHSTRAKDVVGLLVLHAAFFLVSWGMEYLVALRMLRDKRPGDGGRAVLMANALSWFLLGLTVMPFGFFVLSMVYLGRLFSDKEL